MFAKICTSSLLVSALCLQVTAHALISPGLGFPANPQRSNVQRPSNNNPCGNIGDIASKISTSTPVNADGNGNFQAAVTDFNAGEDGSRKVIGKVDPTGKGKNFKDIQVTKNGNPNPTSSGTDEITANIPKGTQCENELCLVQFVTTAGFGNCVVVKQQGGNGNGNDPVRTSAAGDSASTPSNPKDGGNKDGGNKDGGNKDGGNKDGGNNAGNKDAGNKNAGKKDAGNSNGGGNNSRAVEDADATSYLPTRKGFTRRVSGRHMARLLGEGAVEIVKRDI